MALLIGSTDLEEKFWRKVADPDLKTRVGILPHLICLRDVGKKLNWYFESVHCAQIFKKSLVQYERI